MGASHAFEIPFVMGNFDEDALTRYILSRKNLEEVKTLSKSMMSYWAEFAHNGDPDKGREGNLTDWQAWDPREGNEKYIIFDSTHDGGIRMTKDYLTEEKQVNLVFEGFGDSSINYRIMFWINYSPTQPQFLEARSQAIMAINKAYKENDITIPFPIRTLDFGIKGGEKLEGHLQALKS